MILDNPYCNKVKNENWHRGIESHPETSLKRIAFEKYNHQTTKERYNCEKSDQAEYNLFR